ncbi:glycerate kinase family protein [Arcanobacterium ihumii]|uniref:glycerate kinase family protein n=1 Tax=Arcanobacterium ihumii TaxID=2138162 RepID=UPI00135B1EFC|nr:glycerate kinase [Arcanobacterium ihumii]
MKIVIAPDSFKETMSAQIVAQTMEDAVHEVWKDAQCVCVPMADGGEGTTQSLVDALNGEIRCVEVVDALGRPRTSFFGWIDKEKLAVLEVAQAIGIEHIYPQDRNPTRSSTVGVGMMLNAISELKPKKIIVGLGGSATNDGGWGMCHELGLKLSDAQGKEIDPFEPLSLANARNLDASGIDPSWYSVDIILACDVNNPLCGDKGASAVFGPQKGLGSKEIAVFDHALKTWGDLLDCYANQAISTCSGAGAAGGLGAAFMAVLQATNRAGVDVVIEAVGLDEALEGADLALTGEGGMDFQTKFGKTPWGVMLAARRHAVPTIAFAGKLGYGVESLYDDGFAAIIPTVRKVSDLETALKDARPSLFEAVKMMCKIMDARNLDVR